MDELLTTRQVAAELQVSESSVKRWCDQGLIPTQRTAGRHRRIARSGLQHFLASSAANGALHAQKRGETPAGLMHVAEAVETYSSSSRQELVQRFQQALVAGDESLCRKLLAQWSDCFHGVAQLGDVLIAGAMERIGRLWECGRAEVFEERRSCEICMHLLNELRCKVADPSPRAPRAIGGSLTGDHYALANQLVELVLREAGWNATKLGGNLPLDTLLAAVRRERPRLLWLSISYVADNEPFIADYNQFYSQLPSDLVVAVGGRALTDQLRPRIGYTAHCDNLEQLFALGQVILRA